MEGTYSNVLEKIADNLKRIADAMEKRPANVFGLSAPLTPEQVETAKTFVRQGREIVDCLEAEEAEDNRSNLKLKGAPRHRFKP